MVVLEIIMWLLGFSDQENNKSFFKPAGTTASVREQLTGLVIEGKRMTKHSLTKK